MISGIGVDIVSVNRIAKVYAKYGSAFSSRILSKCENELLQKIQGDRRQNSFLAKRFAAKEAYAKALGTGMRGDVTFASIDIANDENGRPFFTSKTFAIQRFSSHLSITDDGDFAVAYVVLERREY